jgi:hypothetical protein
MLFTGIFPFFRNNINLKGISVSKIPIYLEGTPYLFPIERKTPLSIVHLRHSKIVTRNIKAKLKNENE